MSKDIREMINKIINHKTLVNEQTIWTADIQSDFDEWISAEAGNVNKNPDGSYSTQDAQWQNKLQDLNALKQYFVKEFI